jgi:hypothetical protein
MSRRNVKATNVWDVHHVFITLNPHTSQDVTHLGIRPFRNRMYMRDGHTGQVVTPSSKFDHVSSMPVALIHNTLGCGT